MAEKKIIKKAKINNDSPDKTGKKVSIEINGEKIETNDNLTLIEACSDNGIEIPALCHHKDLLPYGACRLCMVEIEIRGKVQLVASCGYYVREGLIVRTSSLRVDRIRKFLTELYMATIPDSHIIQSLAHKYRIKESRYKRNMTYCILCGLCVRYCREVKGSNAVGTIGRGQNREVAWIPLSTYYTECEKCNECIPICPTGVFPSNWGVARIDRR